MSVRTMFTAILLLVGVGLAYLAAVGLMQR
ncbi:hypothetical protein SAURM35S_05059 [Streptomyces aurantiogriseus]